MSTLAHADDQFPFLGEITSNNVNIRAGQNVNFESLGHLQKGSQVVMVSKNYGWYKIKLPPDAKSYISAGLVKRLNDGIGQVTGSRVNIRARAGINSAVIGQLEKGQYVNILNNTFEKWYQIKPSEGLYGWVLEQYVIFKSVKIPMPRIVEPPTRNIYVKRRIARQKAAEEKKRLAAIKAKEEEEARKKRKFIASTGIVEPLGSDSVSDSIRHRLIVDGKTVYLLKGYRGIIDWFLNHKVVLEGELKPSINSQFPIVLVTKIKLVL